METDLSAHATRMPSDDLSRLRLTIRGPVTDVLRAGMPELQGMPREAAYERIMRTPDLLDGCFRLFRSRPELFEAVARAPDGTVARADDQVLPCGRVLGDVIALIVRAAARRYFRLSLDRKPPRLGGRRQAARRPFWRAALAALGLGGGAAARPAGAARIASRGDRLFAALRDNLRYEWQIPLLPHYLPLAPELVRELGQRILIFRTAEELAHLAREPGLAKASLTPPAPRVTRKPGDVVQALLFSPREVEAMWGACQRAGGPAALGLKDEAELRAVIAHASRPKEIVMKVFEDGGVDREVAALLLCRLAARLGPHGFRHHLGPETMTDSADLLREILRHAPLGGIGKATAIARTDVICQAFLESVGGSRAA